MARGGERRRLPAGRQGQVPEDQLLLVHARGAEAEAEAGSGGGGAGGAGALSRRPAGGGRGRRSGTVGLPGGAGSGRDGRRRLACDPAFEEGVQRPLRRGHGDVGQEVQGAAPQAAEGSGRRPGGDQHAAGVAGQHQGMRGDRAGEELLPEQPSQDELRRAVGRRPFDRVRQSGDVGLILRSFLFPLQDGFQEDGGRFRALPGAVRPFHGRQRTDAGVRPDAGALEADCAPAGGFGEACPDPPAAGRGIRARTGRKARVAA